MRLVNPLTRLQKRKNGKKQLITLNYQKQRKVFRCFLKAKRFILNYFFLVFLLRLFLSSFLLNQSLFFANLIACLATSAKIIK